jgi:hypothetical protein
MAAAAEGDEENMIALNKLDAFASQARGYKVAVSFSIFLKGSSASFGSASDLERRSSRDRLILPIAVSIVY